MAQARRPTDRLVKKATREEILKHADELDARRREQIDNQKKIINRLVEINQHYEGTLSEIGEGVEVGAPQLAREALNKAVEINKKHREREDKA